MPKQKKACAACGEHPSIARELCTRCYQRARAAGAPAVQQHTPKKARPVECWYCGSGTPPIIGDSPGLCSTCYGRRRRTGSWGRPTRPTEEQRFWARVNKNGRRVEYMETECWEWDRPAPSGYGKLTFHGKDEHAHRASWMLAHGAIPDGLHVLHHCDNRACVRPDHLFLGTNLDNILDMRAKSRQPHGTAHHMAKLTEDLVREVRRRAVTETVGAIAADLGVSRACIHAAVQRWTWVHVD